MNKIKIGGSEVSILPERRHVKIAGRFSNLERGFSISSLKLGDIH